MTRIASRRSGRRAIGGSEAHGAVAEFGYGQASAECVLRVFIVNSSSDLAVHVRCNAFAARAARPLRLSGRSADSSASDRGAPLMSMVENASSISRMSLAVSARSAAGRLSSRCSTFVPPGIGTMKGFWASSQASAIRAGRGVLARGEFFQEVDHLEVGFERLGREAREVLPEIVRVIELHVPGDRTGQETLAERTPGDEADAQFLAQVQAHPAPAHAATANSGSGWR